MNDDLLAPFEATPSDPFDLEKAGHLARRAGLGASLAQRERLAELGPARAVESFFARGEGDDVDVFADTAIATDDADRLRGYRCWRLLAGRFRLRERMSLFWHGHFATSIEKVMDAGAMARQLRLFDELGLGRFETLCAAVMRDPAMLHWLDADRSVKGHANENLARELFELFALGRGAYGERDVQEAARAMTGWVVHQGVARFAERRHDDAQKTVLDRQGPLGLDDVVAATVSQLACARFLAAKLLACFVHPEPSDAEIEALATRWRQLDGDVGKVLRVLLRSRMFFAPRARRSRVKDPLELAVGLVRELGARASPRQLADAASRMGQTLLAPPSVEGWPRDRAWLSSSSWLLRANFVLEVLRHERFALEPSAEAILGAGTPRERLDRAMLVLCDGALPAAGRDALARWLEKVGVPSAVEILHAVMTVPEAQLQ